MTERHVRDPLHLRGHIHSGVPVPTEAQEVAGSSVAGETAAERARSHNAFACALRACACASDHLQDFHQVLYPSGLMHGSLTMQEAQANGSDGLVAVRINNDWYLFSRAAAPQGHEQVG